MLNCIQHFKIENPDADVRGGFWKFGQGEGGLKIRDFVGSFTYYVINRTGLSNDYG